ncbi:hypothetical protein E2C01_096576 [Portunus trituberculatus]|uniref:Uncharacterized protein n=1 Tax=Portunus trituberculatus TaxID=210409 RepID=A0A5B7K356_PORTR|nr:hypothetical protein [Portunus trituberculatus]
MWEGCWTLFEAVGECEEGVARCGGCEMVWKGMGLSGKVSKGVRWCRKVLRGYETLLEAVGGCGEMWESVGRVFEGVRRVSEGVRRCWEAVKRYWEL